MGLLGKLIKTAVVAGGAIAAVKVSEQYSQNNPNGVSDPEAKKAAIKQAANEVYQSAFAAAREKAPGLTNVVEDLTHGNASEAASKVVGMAKEKAPELIKNAENLAKEKAPDLTAKVQSAASVVADKAKQFADSLDDGVVDADIVEFEEKENKEDQ